MIEPMGWEGLDRLLAEVQRDFPLAGPALGQARGELSLMRFLFGTEPLPEAGDAGAPVPARPRPEADGGKQQQTLRDTLAFEPTTRHAAVAVATDVVPRMDPRLYGFTGNMCQDCGGARMIRSGTCEKCADCGGTSGCS